MYLSLPVLSKSSHQLQPLGAHMETSFEAEKLFEAVPQLKIPKCVCPSPITLNKLWYRLLQMMSAVFRHIGTAFPVSNTCS
ncbi:conserved hypothetical protein [Xenorhabdus nematophila F1]|uniref:Uncharacterized protein n=1 Tax=Xenorhabdus nematophila (strain ATCC 19061 / DSM 3370 / CCUG 14189 / LMG 1036 / NCIMB 9965 / AN6) TaxID=406817 RepID=D3VBD6_XENNA|nr:hypothetical protein XNC1_1512 [Xenorhabdus nematophila ATCC 19061]CCW29489.1 conserved hypothetical protein [Xenorhabdus nematophila F1]